MSAPARQRKVTLAQLQARVERLETTLQDAGAAAAALSTLAASGKRLVQEGEALASQLAMAAAHLEDVLRRLQ